MEIGFQALIPECYYLKNKKLFQKTINFVLFAHLLPLEKKYKFYQKKAEVVGEEEYLNACCTD